MAFLDSIKRGLRLIKLDGSAAVELAQDKSSLIYGWVIIIVAGFLTELSSAIKIVPFNVSDFILGLLPAVIIGPVLILIYHGIAKLFGGQSKLPEYFRAQSHTYLLNWLGIFTAIELPGASIVISLIISIWGIVMSVIILKAIHKLNTWKAIVVALALPLILIILIVIGAAAYFGILSPDRFLPAKVI